jgi:hypothetical protein
MASNLKLGVDDPVFFHELAKVDFLVLFWFFLVLSPPVSLRVYFVLALVLSHLLVLCAVVPPPTPCMSYVSSFGACLLLSSVLSCLVL